MGRGAAGGPRLRTVILDSEAVQALREPGHSKHRAVVAHLEGVAHRRRRSASVVAVVPTAVRVEAGWNRSRPASAAVNRFRVEDRPLDTSAADTAADIHVEMRTGVTDSHIGATARRASDGHVIVITSDPDDVVLASSPRTVTAVRI